MKPQNIFEAPLPDLVLGGPVREKRQRLGFGRRRRRARLSGGSRRKPNPPPSPPPKVALSIDDLIDRKKGRPKPVRGDYLLNRNDGRAAASPWRHQNPGPDSPDQASASARAANSHNDTSRKPHAQHLNGHSTSARMLPSRCPSWVERHQCRADRNPRTHGRSGLP